MSVSLIVAVSENGVIGREGQLPWRLSADLRRFKQLTMGHHILMGRKTFESIGRLLPGRKSVIISRQEDYQAPGAIVVSNLEQAWEVSGKDDQVFVIGGEQIYQQALTRADRIYLTVVHGQFEGDAHFGFDAAAWSVREESRHAADQRNSHEHTFRVLQRV